MRISSNCLFISHDLFHRSHGSKGAYQVRHIDHVVSAEAHHGLRIRGWEDKHARGAGQPTGDSDGPCSSECFSVCLVLIAGTNMQPHVQSRVGNGTNPRRRAEIAVEKDPGVTWSSMKAHVTTSPYASLR